MNQTIVIICSLLCALTAQAEKYRTVEIKDSNPNYEINVSYPELLAESVPSYELINQQLKTFVLENGCEQPDSDQRFPYYYEMHVEVSEINQNYVGLNGSFSDYCGGAHPNHGRFFLTFSSENGKQLDVDREFGFLDWDDPNHDYEKDEVLRAQLAEFMVDHLKPEDEEECYSGTREEKLEELKRFSPSVAGLSKDKSITLMTYPPHAAMPCQVSVEVNYSTISSMIEKTSYLHRWLK